MLEPGNNATTCARARVTSWLCSVIIFAGMYYNAFTNNIIFGGVCNAPSVRCNRFKNAAVRI